jgi:LysR family transcriptional activator of nhaA
VTFFASQALASRLEGRFPQCLDGAPVLMPGEGTALRRDLEAWFESKRIRPAVAAEIEDSALATAFGQDGLGVFAAPCAVEQTIVHQHEVEVVGRETGLVQRFYALSVERRLQHPAVVAILEAAREELFAEA